MSVPDLESQSSNSRAQRFSLHSFLSTALTIMALGVPILYLVGLAFDQGYQSVFNVPQGARSAEFYETLTLGFFALHYALQFINAWMQTNWYMVLGYAVAVGLATAIALWSRPEWTREPKKTFSSWAKVHADAMKGLASIAIAIFVFILPYIAVLLILVVLTLPLLSFRVGAHVGHRDLLRHASTCEIAAANPDHYMQCVTARRGTDVISGYVIAATSSYFVVALNGQTRAIPIEGWQFESRYAVAPTPASPK